MRTLIIKLLFFSLLILGVGCTNEEKEPAAPADPILIGAIYNLTGDQSQLGVASTQGAELAVRQINHAGGVFGRPLKLVLKDGETRPEKIKTEAEQLAANPDISVVIGLSDSNMALAAAPTVASHKKIFITSGATSPLLPSEVPEYLFLSCFGDNTQAAAAAEFAYKRLGLHDVAIFFDRDRVYTTGLSSYFRERFTQLGGKVISIQSFSHDNPSIKEHIKALTALDAKPQFIFLSAEPEAPSILISELRRAGFNQPIIGGDGFVAEPIIAKAGKYADDVYFTTHVFFDKNTKNPVLKGFIDAYHNAYNAYPSNPFAALGYDTVNLVISAMRRAKALDSDALLKALNNTKDFKGATGSISFVGGNKVPMKSVSIVHIKNGKPTLAAKWLPKIIPAPALEK